ncbi:hypothetical protein B0O99DRAFT_590768 [Bisporella sp. PMI_857]|nr:hypothetical protein B0O99DRAFT_590768 [Bisporella sp. PMI_857]
MAPILMPVAKHSSQVLSKIPITEPTISHLFRGELKNPLQNGSTDVIVKYISQTGDSTSGEDLLQHLYVLQYTGLRKHPGTDNIKEALTSKANQPASLLSARVLLGGPAEFHGALIKDLPDYIKENLSWRRSEHVRIRKALDEATKLFPILEQDEIRAAIAAFVRKQEEEINNRERYQLVHGWFRASNIIISLGRTTRDTNRVWIVNWEHCHSGSYTVDLERKNITIFMEAFISRYTARKRNEYSRTHEIVTWIGVYLICYGVENILDSEGQEKALELQKLVGLGRDYLYHLGKRNLEFFNGQEWVVVSTQAGDGRGSIVTIPKSLEASNTNLQSSRSFVSLTEQVQIDRQISQRFVDKNNS